MLKKKGPKGKHSVDAAKEEPSGADSLETAVMPPVPEADATEFAGVRAATATPNAFSTGDAATSVPAGFAGVDIVPKKSGKGKKIAAIVCGSILGVLLLVYVAGGVFFSGHFLPRTTMGTENVSLMDATGIAGEVDGLAKDYSITVAGQGVNFTVSSAEAGIAVDGQDVAAKALALTNPWTWPVQITKTHDVSEALAAEFNGSGLEDIVRKQIDEFNATASDPTNATIQYDGDKKSFDVKDEEVGTKLDSDSVLKVVDAAAVSMEPKATLTEAELLQPTVRSDDARLATAAEKANAYVKADLKLKLNDLDAGEVNGEQISQWVRLNENYEVSFDQDAMNNYCTDLAASFDTIGTERSYTTPYGKDVTVSGGTYGWEVDSDAMYEQLVNDITAGTQGDFYVPLVASGATYDGPGKRDWGNWADVDLSEQHARYYAADGTLLWEADCVTGIPDGKHDTPTGIWNLFIHKSPAILKGDVSAATGKPEYETPVDYWMQFTASGCGFHDATWQSAFGGTRFQDGYGSHGCVNLSYSDAQSLYDVISAGEAVIVHW